MNTAARCLCALLLGAPVSVLGAEVAAVEPVALRCGEPVSNNERIESAAAAQPSVLRLSLAPWLPADCGPLLHHAAVVSPGMDVLGPGTSDNDVPNGDFARWSGEHFRYLAPTFGRPGSYNGTGGLKVEHAACWTSKVWGAYGSGTVERKLTPGGRPYLQWSASSVPPPANACQGRRVACVDDRDATGFHHVRDAAARVVVRAGTAGHELSQMLPLEEFIEGWVTLRLRMRHLAGNHRFYLRLIQGHGRDGQMRRSVSYTLPGIALVRDERTMDYVVITHLQAPAATHGRPSEPVDGTVKYLQIALSSAVPQLGHEIEVFRIALHRGINAPASAAFGSTDPRLRQHAAACQ